MKQNVVLFIGMLIVAIPLRGMLQNEKKSSPKKCNTSLVQSINALGLIQKVIKEMEGVQGAQELLAMYKKLEKEYEKS